MTKGGEKSLRSATLAKAREDIFGGKRVGRRRE